MKVEIYSIPNCPYCVRAKNLAEQKGHEVVYNMMGEVSSRGCKNIISNCQNISADYCRWRKDWRLHRLGEVDWLIVEERDTMQK